LHFYVVKSCGAQGRYFSWDLGRIG